VVFGGLPNGTWIVREWSIRMPRVSITPDRSRISVTGYTVQGGIVWRVTEPGGKPVVEAETATVAGTVVDSTDAGPVAGAVVRVEDGGVEAATAEAGSFLLAGLAAGLHRLEVRHPSLDSLGLGAAPFEVVATAGEITSTRLRLPGVEETLAAACADTPRQGRETAMLLVRVREGSAPAAGVPVRVGWLGSDPEGFDVSARAAPSLPGHPAPEWRPDPDDPRTVLTALDERGIFLLCAVPTRSEVRVQVDEGEGLEIHRVQVPSGAPVVVVTLSRRKVRAP